MSGKRWCFTLNNYVEDELVALRSSLSTKARFAIFGKEIGASGTPHLQGYVAFGSNYRQKAFKELVGVRAHVEVAKADEASNIRYCSKGVEIEEFGRRSNRGKRSDVEAFRDAVKGGLTDEKVIRDQHMSFASRCPNFVTQYIRDQLPRPVVPLHPLKPWQAALNSILILAPNSRDVIFVVDSVGNKGKSWFAKHYCSLHDNAFLIRPQKKADMAFMLPNNLRVLFIDVTRKQCESMEYVYTFIEELKDGYVASPKYISQMRTFGLVHVVMLMNKQPDLEALSEDRYHLISLDEED